MNIVLEIPAQKIADLMVTAIEGNHAWHNGIDLISPKSYEKAVDLNDKRPWYAKHEVYEKSFEISVEEILDDSGKNIKKHTVGSVQMAEAFRLMAEKHPRSFAEFMAEDYDIITADVFLQLCALGEVVYG